MIRQIAHCYRFRMLGAPVLLIAGIISLAHGAATAQGLNFGSGNPDQPIEVVADDGIEWQQENEVMIARGNARASRSGVTVSGDVLRAYYKKKPQGGTDLTQLDAVGNVKIASGTEVATGESAVYDMAKAILVLRGRRVRFSAGQDVLTANQQMEYYERDLQAIARGNAVASREGKSVRADVLVAFLRKDKRGKTSIHRVQAFENVIIKTAQDTVRSNRGIYNVRTGIATLSGGVHILRGGNILEGDLAEINLNTGVSKLLMAPGPKSRSGRVRGLLLPSRDRRNPGGKSR